MDGEERWSVLQIRVLVEMRYEQVGMELLKDVKKDMHELNGELQRSP